MQRISPWHWTMKVQLQLDIYHQSLFRTVAHKDQFPEHTVLKQFSHLPEQFISRFIHKNYLWTSYFLPTEITTPCFSSMTPDLQVP
jgi:hypothetical protein